MLISTSSYAQYTILLNFAGTTNGESPHGDLISDGTFFYGMTYEGGTNDIGTIFKIMHDGTGYAKLLDFASATTGRYPSGSLTSDGTFLYGMTKWGGSNGNGNIFKIMPDGTGFIQLFEFALNVNGGYPLGSLISDGTFLYGMTQNGGTNTGGTIFKIMPDGTGFVKIFDFSSVISGNGPKGSLTFDGTFLYGMTELGGTNNLGTIFKIMPDGTGYSKLLDFAGASNGSLPYGSLIYDGTFLYGMTLLGGINDFGTIFKIMPDGTGYSNLLDFAGTSNGRYPMGSLISDGTFLYGTTTLGGTNSHGTIFKIMPDGTNYEKLLDLVFLTGAYPWGSLFSDGTFLYGMTEQGGTSGGKGVLFKYSPEALDIDELLMNNNELLVYPNPASDNFTISINAVMKNAQVEICNVFGEKVYSTVLNNKRETINTKQFSSGIYFVKVSDGEKLFTKKLILE